MRITVRKDGTTAITFRTPDGTGIKGVTNAIRYMLEHDYPSEAVVAAR